MFDNSVLDIAIGLIMMFLVLSLIGTVINEFISTWMDVRASTLQGAITTLLDDTTLKSAFYSHGLIAGISDSTRGHPSYLSGQTFAGAIIGSLSNNPLPTIDSLKESISKMPDTNIRDTLLAQVTKSGDDIDKFRNEIANYFDVSMDRVTGLYKRYMKKIALIVGFVLVIVLNADSITVGTALWKDGSLRAQMVSGAQTMIASGLPAAPAPNLSVDKLTTDINELQTKIRPLPIGWTADHLADMKARWKDGGGDFVWWLVVKLIGLSITAFAVSLGAPFWFDLLSKFMNVRGTGNKPATTEISEVKQPPAATLTVVTQQPPAPGH